MSKTKQMRKPVFDSSRIAAAEEVLGYKFVNKSLISEALTHSSYANEHNLPHNERLEFLGDAVVEMIVSEELFKDNKSNEGTLTQLRQKRVSTPALAAATERAGLENIVLSKGLESLSDKSKAGVFEAVAAALYLDGGWKVTKTFVDKYTDYEDIVDYKSRLAEYAQEKKIGTVEYTTVDESGLQHCKTYYVKANLGELESQIWKAPKKQAAEKLAARELCDKIGII